MDAIGYLSVARSQFLQKMYNYHCVRKPGHILEFAHLRGNLYQCMQCKRRRKMRSVSVVNDELVPGKLHPEEGHHADCTPLPEAGKSLVGKQ